MRAYAIDRRGTVQDVSLHELPKPSPGPDELLVRVRGAALNPADLKVLKWISAAPFLHAKKYPLTLGYDFSGTVEALGSDVQGRAAGDEVYGFLPYARSTRGGSFADFLAVDAGSVGTKPKSLSHAEAAAAATSMATALQSLRKSIIPLGAGTSVLINGASGGVGSCAVQIAKNLGARVVATASASKAKFVTDLGADQVYDYKTSGLEALRDKARQDPGAERFEMLFDVASNSSFGVASPLLKPSGTYVALLPSPGFFLGMAASAFSSKRCAFTMVRPAAKDFDEIAGWFDGGKLKGMVDQTYPFAELKAALVRQEAGEFRGKLAISID